MGGSIALTFDDGPDPVRTPPVLDALEEAGARATFFVVAPLARRYPSLLRRASGAGHEIALHCARHLRHDRMEAACARLLAVRGPDGLICSTDADTVVAPDWLSAQLKAVEAGARAIGGRIDLADARDLPPGVLRWHAENSRLRCGKVLADPDQTGKAEHWQFSGASLALTAGTYAGIGGLQPQESLEDEHLEEVPRGNGVPIGRLLSVRVRTSARLKGGASRGLSYDLSKAALRHRTSAPREDPKPSA